MFYVLEPKQLKACRCWPKPHTCLMSSNEVVTCTPGKQIDERTVCCKVKEVKQEQEVRESEQRKKRAKQVKTLPGKLSNLKHKLRWLRHKRLGRFVALAYMFIVIFIYIEMNDSVHTALSYGSKK